MPRAPDDKLIRFSEEEVQRLFMLYSDAEREILDEINRALLKGNKTEYLNAMKENVQAILKDLRSGSRTWCEQAIPRVYIEGAKSADTQMKAMGTEVKVGFAAIHQQAAQVLAEAAYNRFDDTTITIGRRVNDIYRTLALENIKGSVVGYKSWQQVAKNFREQLAVQGVTGFKDVKGRKWNMRTYAEMVSRTTTMEAHLQGTALRLQEHGHDLVKVSTHSGTCEKCAPWQGKILSLSGQSTEYPSLQDAKDAGLFHPRCRHAYGLYIDLDEDSADIDNNKTPQSQNNANSPWVDTVKQKITTKPTGEVEIREIGKVIREAVDKNINNINSRVSELTEQCNKLLEEASALFDIGKIDEANVLFAKSQDFMKQISDIQKKTGPDMYHEALAQIRPMGNSGIQAWTKGSKKAVKDAVTTVSKYFPSDWLEKSYETEMIAKQVKRGYYKHMGSSLKSEIALSGQSVRQIERCALHEMGHRFEYVVPGIKEAEKEFYTRRTQGEVLQWMGPGYSSTEKTRKDQFVHLYMGKDYNGRAYELLSMGLEGLFAQSYPVASDLEFVDFILGVMAAL